MTTRLARRRLSTSVLASCAALLVATLVGGGPVAAAPQEAPDGRATDGSAASGHVLDRAPSGCRTRSAAYPWGRQALRTWTPASSDGGQPVGTRTGEAFRARLVSAHGHDARHSPTMVLLEFTDGCRRTYRADSFAAADRELVRREVERRIVVDRPQHALDRDDRFVSADDVASGRVERHSTGRFTFWYGVDREGFSYRSVRERGSSWEEMLAVAGRSAEDTWDQLELLDSPMPYAGSREKRKLNVYICGTGLPFAGEDRGDCGASAGAQSMFVSSIYLEDGSTTFLHELVHVLQDFSGGFRGPAGAGNIWEGHAEWANASLNPTFNIWYLQNLENGPTWFTNRYGMYPLLLQLSQRPATRSLVWRAWLENDRDANGDTTEEYLETVVRLGQRSGVYPRGWRSFADEVGWFGARLAAEDLEQQAVLRTIKGWPQEASRWVGLRRGSGAGTWSSSAQRPLWQFGTHLVPLRTRSGDEQLTVSLRGRTASQAAAWRYGLVRVDRDSVSGSATYSALGATEGRGRGGVVRVGVRPGSDYYLAVSATPGRYVPIEASDDPSPAPTTFPYEVRLGGAAPKLPGSGTCLGPYIGDGAANLNWHTNGHYNYDRACD